MSTTVDVVFDGQALWPQTRLNLKTDAHYSITIDEKTPDAPMVEDAWSILEGLAGSVEAPADWSLQHDHYIYGTPKKQ